MATSIEAAAAAGSKTGFKQANGRRSQRYSKRLDSAVQNGGSSGIRHRAEDGAPESRFSWNPEWMQSLTWMDAFTIPLQQLVDEGSDEDSVDMCRDAAEDATWDDTPEEEWAPFFANVCRAITHPTPWSSGQYTPDVRRDILTNVTAHFLERCHDRRTVGRRMKEILNDVIREDKVSSIQTCYVTFMEGECWEGFDTYRVADNFYTAEDYTAFRDSCMQRVQFRLHTINTDWSRKEARVGRAIDIWNEVHQSDECFGGPLTLVLDTLTIDERASFRGSLPKRATALVQIIANGEVLSESFVRRAAVRSQDGSQLIWDPPQPVGLHIGGGDVAAVATQLSITIIANEGCGVCQPKDCGSVTMSLDCLYDGILPLNSDLRNNPAFGVHHWAGDHRDARSGIVLTGAVSLSCLDESHHHRPPRIDVVREQEKRRKVLEARQTDAWRLDHHAAFLKLVDMLGELTDADCLAMKLYSDRFLIHDELYDIALFMSTVSRGRFSDADSRELLKISVEQLKAFRPKVTTRIGAKLCDDALLKARKGAIDRIAALEDVTDEPSEAADVFTTCKVILDVCGIPAADLFAVIQKRAQEDAETLTKKLRKLITLVHAVKGGGGAAANASPKGSAAAAAAANRPQSVLLELEQQSDKELLVGKSRVLYDLVDRGLSVATNALMFAKFAENDAVLGIAQVRVEVMIRSLTPIVQTAVIAVISELAQSIEPDPLGDTFGILTVLYERVMGCVDLLLEFAPLEHLAEPLAKIFDNYLPGWFSLCRDKVYSWIRSIVREEHLVPILPGKVFCNQAPSDTNNLLSSLAEVFTRCLQWAEFDMIPSHITSFNKLVQSVSDEFLTVMLAKGNTAHETSELCVCMSSFVKFQDLLQRFWTEDVFDAIVKEVEDETQMIVSQATIIMKETMARVTEVIDEFGGSLRGKMRKWATDKVFSQQGAADASQVDDEFCDFVHSQLSSELRVVCESLDEKLANSSVLPEVVTAFHIAFVEYVTQMASLPLKDARERTAQRVLEAVDTAIEDVCGARVGSDLLFELSQKSRSRIQLGALSSADLVKNLKSTEGKPPSREREHLLTVLHVRRDAEALAYLKQLDKKSGKN